ncbi:hypothetical protein Harreka1_5 [Olleya phage Harreka_1]|uniref:Uncharacterized protein n=1 Tax=Olleya phage Harreka_1 TaxID=2745673 RepID=A0A8E4ZCG5_9CAUD|nr:hypothetical protein M1M26_gp05 [Olleya phage Harreka_1]QQV90412.1 hypothetical protein Harreka1_5 [Olleya phage Harreka_1]
MSRYIELVEEVNKLRVDKSNDARLKVLSGQLDKINSSAKRFYGTGGNYKSAWSL